MALKITLPPDSPVLTGGGYQSTELYARIAGLHYVKRTDVCSVPLEYYASEADAKAEPEGPQIFPRVLPRSAPIMRPGAVLDAESAATRAVCYGAVKLLIEALGGPGTIVEPA